MPKFDLTITISAIVALCAIISPIITSFINNHYQYKIKQLELEHSNKLRSEDYRKKLCEKYFINVSKHIACHNEKTLQEYSESYLIAFLYFRPTNWTFLRQINKAINDKNWENATNLLEDLIRKLPDSDYIS